MKTLRLFAGIGFMLVAFVATSSFSFATPDFAKKEKKQCVSCHEGKLPKKGDPSSKLNKDGQEYKKTLPKK